MWKILSSDLCFNETDFPKLMAINPSACRAYFTSVLGRPFDGNDLESVVELIQETHHNTNVMGRVIYFIWNFLDPKGKERVDAPLTRTAEEIREVPRRLRKKLKRHKLLNTGALPKESDPANPFKFYSAFWVSYEYLIRYNDDPKWWPKYQQKQLAYHGLGHKEMAIHNCQMKVFLRQHGIDWQQEMGRKAKHGKT